MKLTSEMLIFFLVAFATMLSCASTGSHTTTENEALHVRTVSPDIPYDGEALFQLTGADYVCPRFSHDGNLLAVSQVLATKTTENTQVLIVSTTDWRVDTLLDSSDALRYAVYKSFVQDMEWHESTDTLDVIIHDGDVEATVVSFDARSGAKLSETLLEPAEELSPERRDLSQRLRNQS